MQPGQRLGGRYRIVEVLGQGGMGVVYRATDEELRRDVAVKTLHAMDDRSAKARLRREARAVAALDHPHIAKVYDIGETEGGGLFVVMELLRGQTLRERLANGPLSIPDVLEVTSSIAEALAYAHSQGFVHRDVKPENIMVLEDKRALLLDFGIAKQTTKADLNNNSESDTLHVTREGTVVGTLAYLAPEQARGADVGPASDQFGLAITAFELLTGRLPWVDDNPTALIAQILIDDPPRPSLVAALPVATDAVFGRALAKSPADRFASVTAFTSALRQACTEESGGEAGDAGGRADGGGAGGRRRQRKNALLTALGVGGLIAVSIAMTASLWERPTPPTSEPLVTLERIACPIFDAEGVPPPEGWLGAMAADLACRHLALRLGGDPSATRGPAELLGLPALAGNDFVTDPYATDGVRERTLVAAAEEPARVTGQVQRTNAGRMRVRLELYRDEQLIGAGEGESLALYEAVATSLRAALAGVERPRRFNEDIAPYLATSNIDVAVAFAELGDANLTGVGVEERCRSLLDADPNDTMLIAAEVRRICMRWGVEGAASLEAAPLDRSSLPTLALTAPARARELSADEAREIAETLIEARRQAESRLARTVYARGAVALLETVGESERARDLLIVAVPDHPRDWFLRVHLVRALRDSPGRAPAAAALAAWHPGTPEAWRTLALPHLDDPSRAAPWLERAYLSGGSLPLHGIYLAHAELRRGRLETVRRIAARYATQGGQSRLAGEYLRARLELANLRFGAAYQRLLDALLSTQRLGRMLDGDVEAIRWLLSLADVLGRDAASALARHFVLSEPHRLLLDQPHYELPAIDICRRSRPAIASRCLRRLRDLRDVARGGHLEGTAELLEGSQHVTQRRWESAALAWRSLLRYRIASLDPEVFQRAGEPEIANQIERTQMQERGFAGVTLAHARQAERAAEEGNTARAGALARQVIDAWSATDVPIAVVAQMRTLLRSLPPIPP